MSKLLSTVRTQVRSFLDETSAADWTDTELDRLINNTYHRVATAAMTVYENYYLTTDLFNTTARQEEYGSLDGITTDIFKIRRVEVNYDVSNSNSAPTRCLPIDMDQISRDLGYRNANIGVSVNSAAGYYHYGHSSNFKIGIIPIPDKTGTDAGKIWYIKQLADLSSDSSALDLPYVDRYWMLVVYGATADALRFGQQDSPEADKYDSKLVAGILLMQEELEDFVAEDSKSVLDTSGQSLDFDI
jgi:hypothetical protein